MCEYFIGVMSGTSMDGVDVALCKINENSCKLIASHEFHFPHELKEEILHTIQGETTLAKIGHLDVALGELFADCIESFIDKYSLDTHCIQAVGLHGQTLWHAPHAMHPFSMQLGSASVVSAQTGFKVVSDFRNMDIANGGEGAPFAPALHQFLFANLSKKAAIINIGGIANITLFEPTLLGWDSGCGNVLMDAWSMQCNNEPYDRDGTFARRGKVDTELLETLLQDPYFSKTPPKSTGREYFNISWLASHLGVFQTICDADIQRTLLELTAQSITNDLKKADIELLIICGGGAKNSFLMERLSELSGKDVFSSTHFGVDADSLEAMVFAWLAYKRLHNQEVALKSVTGAKQDSILGAIYG